MIPSVTEKFDRPWVLLCEGPGDHRFFHRLFEVRGIPEKFSIRYPHKDGKWSGGRGAFGADLLNISVNEDFITNVKAILVVSDKDDDPDKSLKEVIAEIKKAKDLPHPSDHLVVAKKKDQPSVVILMLPLDGKGNLETLCLESAHAAWGLKAELDAFVDACPAKSWGIAKQSKMRMQTILAATNDDQPDAGFTAHWTQKPKYQIPLDNVCFDELVEFLNKFGELIA
jgi:hypothetical protein